MGDESAENLLYMNNVENENFIGKCLHIIHCRRAAYSFVTRARASFLVNSQENLEYVCVCVD